MNTVIRVCAGSYSKKLINILKHRWVARMDTAVVMLFYSYFVGNSSLL